MIQTYLKWICAKRPAYIITVIILVFICASLINNLLFRNIRLDLTEDQIFTLSSGTKEIISELEEPITIRLFYNKDVVNQIPLVQSYGNRIIGLLKQYSRLSHGKLTFSLIEPTAFSKEEDQAVSLGIQPIALDESSTDKLYFGLVATNSIGNVLNIPFLDPTREAFLEYDLTHMIYRLSHMQKPKIGILSWINLESQSNPKLQITDEWSFVEQLKELYDVTLLDTKTKTIDPTLDALLVVHPTDISRDTEYAIDQYVVRGGKTMIFVDPFLEIPGMPIPTSTLPRLFKHWHIAYDKEQVVLDAQNAVRVPIKDERSPLHEIDKLNWLALGKHNANATEISTGDLKNVHFISAGALTQPKATDDEKEKNTLEMTPLFYTSSDASTVKTFNVFEPVLLLQEFVPTDTSYVLGARFSGTFTSAFDDKKNKDHIAASEKPTHVVVIADVDMLRDTFWLQKQRLFNKTVKMPFADNGAFVENMVDQLTGSSSLVGLRSRQIKERPFTYVEKLRQKAEIHFLEEEQHLQDQLRATEEKLSSLQQTRQDGHNLSMNEEQKEEMERFQNQLVETRSKLRDVQHRLREEIEGLGSTLKLLLIGLLPLLVIIAGFILPKHLGIRRP